MSFRRRALFLAGLFVAVSCSDAGNPLGPEGPEPAPQPGEVLQALTCTVSVNDPKMHCAPPAPGTGGALGNVSVVGGTNGVFVELTKLNHFFDADSMWFDVTLANYTGQTLGTVNGSTADADSVRVFFLTEPNPTSGGVVTVGHPSGADGITTGAPQDYYTYPGMLADSAVSPSRRWHFNLDAGATTFTFQVMVRSKVQFPRGWLKIRPRDPIMDAGAVDTLEIRSRNRFGLDENENVTWSSSDSAVVSVNEISPRSVEITAGSEGTAWVKAQSDSVVRVDSVLVTVNTAPLVPGGSTTAVTNVTVARPAPGLLAGATDNQSLSVVPGTVTSLRGGRVRVNADGSYRYLSAADSSGTDSFQYQVTDGTRTTTGTFTVNILPSSYWYVQAGATGGDGRDSIPFGSIAAAQAKAGPNDTIFVLKGATTLNEAVVLENGQGLVGRGIADSLYFHMSATDSVAVLLGGDMPGVTHTAPGATVTLAQNNVIRGVGITSVDAAAIHGVGFGTLTVGEVSVQAGGPALSLVNGNLAGSFMALHSLNSDSAGLNLQSVGGVLTATAASISGAATIGMSVTNGSVDISFPGAISHGGTGRVLDVNNHSGDATFQGAVTVTAGTGMLFTAASGAYTFNGAVNLAGGDAGLDLSGSDGVFTFANASITNPSGGPAVNVVGGSPALVYRGSITHNTGRAVLVDGIAADSVVLRAAITSGTSGAPTGLGVLVQNVTGGLVALDSATSLFTAANPAVTLNNPAGSVRFGHSLDITTTTGAGFTASGAGTVSVTGVNTVATSTGIPVSLMSVNTGTAGVSFSSVATSAGAANGIVLDGITGAGFQATGGTISATTGPAVLLTSTNGADSVSLRGMTLSRSSGAGAVISGTTFGKLHALNTSVQATGGPSALVLATGTMSGTYSTVSSNSSTGSGVSLTGVNGTFNASAGSINTAGLAAFLLSGGNVGETISATVAQASAVPLLSVAGDHSGTFTFAGNLTASNGTGLQFTAADGTYNVTGSLSLAGGDAGIDIGSASSGTVNVTPAGANTAVLTSPSGTAISIVGGSADLNYSGNVTQANSQPLLSVTGGHAGDVAFPSGIVNASNGNGLQFDNADGTYDFDGTVTLQGGDAGIDITNGSGGTFTFPTTANIVSPSTGNLVSILNSAPTFTYPGAFTKANNNVTGILVSNNTGGSITFSGTGTKSIISGTAAAVNLANNGSASILFSGGGLSITSGSGSGITATGGGTLQVTGGTNTIISTGGVALNVQNTTIGASGLSFQSISANGGANGIVLNNTGSTNGLQVTGTGTTAGSGGTIQNTTVSGASFTDARNINLGLMNFTNANSVDGGGAGSCDLGTNAGCNAAIKLSSVTTVNLDRLNVNGTVEHGINGRTVTDFSLTNSSILNSGDSGSEFAVSLFELFGTAGGGTENLISGNTLSDAGEHVIFVRTSTATSASPASPDRLVISSNTIADPGTRNAVSGSQGDGITVSLRGTANFQTLVQNNTFNTSETGTDGVQVDAGDTSRSDATITGNHFNGSYAVGGTNIAAYNTAVNMSGSGSSNTTFSVTNNPTVMVGVGNAINVASNGDANLRGTVSGHTINTPAGLRDGVSNGSNLENAGFGIDMVVDQTGSIVANVTNNTVAGGHMTAFRSTARNGNGGSVDANVSNNVFNSGGLFAQWPVMLMAGNDAAGESARLCFNLSNNQTSTTAAFTEHYWMEVWDAPTAGFNNVIQFQGLVPASGATEAQVETHVDASDPSPPPAGVGKVEAFGAEVINYTAATCATP